MKIAKLLYRSFELLSSGLFTRVKKVFRRETKSDEYQQSLLRVIAITVILTYLAIYFDGFNYHMPIVWLACMCLSLALLFHIIQSPQFNHKRIIFAIAFDVLATTYSMGISDAVGSLFISVYLWLIVGYGLRYGRKYLIITALSSMAGYLYTINTNQYWLSNPKFAYGLAVTLIVVPIYAYVLTQKLKQETERAEKNSKAKSEFLSHISHEIRTPLNGIIGAAELMQVKGNENKENLNIIRTSAKHLTDLVTGVLDLASIEQGKTKSNIVNFQLDTLINDCMDLFSSNAKSKNIELIKEISSGLPNTFEGEFLLIKEVIINLVGNAVKFTDTGFIKLEVDMAGQVGDTFTLKFKVSDTGIGMSQKAMDTIFESFTQADDSVKYTYGGTGLGTTISKHLVESMGGNIGVTSDKGQGTVFWFELPLRSVKAIKSAENNVIELDQFSKLNSKENGFRVLIADDAEINRMLLRKVLVREGFIVDEVTDGEEALNKLETNQYDLIILDNNMPKMGGLEAMNVYHALHATAAVGTKTPVFIFSADATTESRERALEQGAAAYLTKPIQIEVMKLAIYQALKNAAPGQSATVLDYKQQNRKHAVQVKQSLLDTERLNGLVGLFGSNEAVVNLINDFIVDLDDNFESLNQFINDNDYIGISQLGHSMAGCASNVGAVSLTKVCKDIEAINPTYKPKDILHLFNKAKSVLAETKISYYGYIDHIKQRNTTT